ncbi:MAG: hypothetical protein OS112_00775 [Methanoregula sp.]|nr:MAG: hypothetical protein OS112_00775 [Methanoregula sp.]
MIGKSNKKISLERNVSCSIYQIGNNDTFHPIMTLCPEAYRYCITFPGWLKGKPGKISKDTIKILEAVGNV